MTADAVDPPPDAPFDDVRIDGVQAPTTRATDRSPDRADSLFERTYPAAVGVARRVLDRDGVVLDSSRPLAEEVAMEAFVRCSSSPVRDDHHGAAKIISQVADSCLDRLVGHPGTVPLHPELLGADIEFDGMLPIAELQEALCDLRRRDRRVGVLALAGGLGPTEVASLLDLPLAETLRSLARIGTRLADGRRLGADHLVGTVPT